MAAVDLPLRVLVYEDQDTGKAAVIANSYDYPAYRHAQPDHGNMRQRYEAALAKGMKAVPTLGLDAFCQKLLIWCDAGGYVNVTFSDLLALAERQQVSGGIALRVINVRLRKTLAEALEQ